MNYENILTAEHGDGALRTGVITLNRPKQLNALNDALTTWVWRSKRTTLTAPSAASW